MKGHGSKFARKQEEAITALFKQRNIDEAAKSIGIASNTLLKWMKMKQPSSMPPTGKRGAWPSDNRLQGCSKLRGLLSR
jgi:transposase-like protein